MKRGLAAFALLVAAFSIFALSVSSADILVFFKDTVSEEQANELMEESGLNWTSLYPKANESGSNFGKVTVPKDKEGYWESRLSQSVLVDRVQMAPTEGVEPVPPKNITKKTVKQGAIPKIRLDGLTQDEYLIFFAILGAVTFIVLIASIMMLRKKAKPLKEES